ncbi:hypothetical protein [Caballeronia novacaledonica]|uniref:Lipoprotein n=1 Tax=Caballeronia novacaledonica TaxID=1544861 RepID=A0AA37MS70_9BURK|nr:hypothetical protein [Caballeronia novacaledonica]GJH29311.1 hypothetical protein CBA19CS42_32365 [Caballeronia novacaledonica]
MTRFLFLPPLLLLGACSTPQPVMDQANLGAAMENELGQSYAAYRKATDDMVADRQALIAARQRAAAEEMNALAPTKFAAAALSGTSGQTAEQRAAQKLGDMADIIASQDANTATSVSKSAQPPSLTPLPVVSDKTVAAQKAFAQMGAEQSFTSRFAEYRTLYETVKKGIAENKKRIDEIEKGSR